MPAIRIENLSKRYRINHEKQRGEYGTLREAIIEKVAAPFRNLRNGAAIGKTEDFWALKDINFEVEPGEVVGIIGRNGAGKSTLLKILSQITAPTTGRVELYGRVGSLLEVGTGFHPELSGRDNIFLNGSILGMGHKEIQKEFDAIVDFSGVEKFLDTPVKRYSSGMKVRLAFAVAAHLQPEILIIDEVLAVGDAEFQKKCLGKMSEVAAGGRTVLFVSHNMAAIRNLCSRAVLLEEGTVTQDTNSNTAIDAYLRCCKATGSQFWTSEDENHDEPLAFKEIQVDLEGTQPHLTLRISVRLCSLRKHERAFIAIDFFDMVGDWVMQAIPTMIPFISYSSNAAQLELEVDLPPLIPGDYGVGLWIGSSLNTTLAEIREAVSFRVDNSPTVGRSAQHHSSRGYIVPVSRITRGPSSDLAETPMRVGDSRS